MLSLLVRRFASSDRKRSSQSVLLDLQALRVVTDGASRLIPPRADPTILMVLKVAIYRLRNLIPLSLQTS
jgi:hypothetical protein